MSPLGQKLRFRVARHPCVIVRSTPVSRPSKGGPAWLLSVKSRHGALRQLTMYAITLEAISRGPSSQIICRVWVLPSHPPDKTRVVIRLDVGERDHLGARSSATQ